MNFVKIIVSNKEASVSFKKDDNAMDRCPIRFRMARHMARVIEVNCY